EKGSAASDVARAAPPSSALIPRPSRSPCARPPPRPAGAGGGRPGRSLLAPHGGGQAGIGDGGDRCLRVEALGEALHRRLLASGTVEAAHQRGGVVVLRLVEAFEQAAGGDELDAG